MHVMFVPSWYSTPRNKVHGSFFKEQAQALAEHGVKVTVAFNEIWPLTLLGKINENKGISIQNEDGLKTYRYKNYNYLPKNPLMFMFFNKRLEKLYKLISEREGKIDLIHAHSSLWGGISAEYISGKYNIPLIITEHSSITYSKYLKPSYKKYVVNSYKNASKLIAVGEGLKEELCDLTKRNEVEVIPNLVNLELFKPMKLEKNSEFTFFSLAFLEGEKGMDTLIKSFAKKFKNINAKLVIGGDGSQKKQLKELSNNLNISDKVEFLGALTRKEVVAQMNKCDCFVLASRHETFGVVYVEALACGKPIIGTYNGGANGIINSENGLIVPIDDEEKLSNAMLEVMKNYSSYDSEIIRNNCENKYSKQNIVKNIIKAYKEVL